MYPTEIVSASVAKTKYDKLGGEVVEGCTADIHLGSAGWKSKMKVPADMGSGDSFLLSFGWPPSDCM